MVADTYWSQIEIIQSLLRLWAFHRGNKGQHIFYFSPCHFLVGKLVVCAQDK